MPNTSFRDPGLKHGGGKGETKTFFHNYFSSEKEDDIKDKIQSVVILTLHSKMMHAYMYTELCIPTHVMRLVITDAGTRASERHKAVKIAKDRLSSSLNDFKNLRIFCISSTSDF